MLQNATSTHQTKERRSAEQTRSVRREPLNQLEDWLTLAFNADAFPVFPWHQLAEITSVRINQRPQADRHPPSPASDVALEFLSHPRGFLITFLLYGVTECALPRFGINTIQFSEFRIEDIRSWQREGIRFRIHDENFREPEIYFSHGELTVRKEPPLLEPKAREDM